MELAAPLGVAVWEQATDRRPQHLSSIVWPVFPACFVNGTRARDVGAWRLRGLSRASSINIATAQAPHARRHLPHSHASARPQPLPPTSHSEHPAPTTSLTQTPSIMADAAVDNPSLTVPPHKKQLPSSIPNFDTLEGFSTEGGDDYSTFKKLQRQLEYGVNPRICCSRRWLTVAGTFTSKKSTSKMSSGA